jgi:hypothetical protein
MPRLFVSQATLVCVLAAAPLSGGPVRTAKEAKVIAEQETRGLALSARKVYLNGATCGWEVIIRMPGEARGWQCVVDCDTRAVFTKTRIPNPAPPTGKRRKRVPISAVPDPSGRASCRTGGIPSPST